MITAERLREIVNYDETTGIFTYRETRGPVPAGGVAGGRGQYHRIAIDGKKYMAHRLAWLYVYGVWPVEQIDHRDEDKIQQPTVKFA